tara:strand:+ start:10388 stop:12133 length:1746 start_codon:yes stop_codon:yes gene_type:complete
MKNITLVLIIVFGIHSKSYAQQSSNNDLYYKIPQEKIFLHYNSSFLLSGEKLLYKIYCINSKTKKLSNLSKIAYVELIDRNGKVHFKHKIRLATGLGQGDFFIPTSLASGNYKVIAYTKWMKNGGKNNFFHGDVTILNPFSDNSEILTIKNDSLSNQENKTSISNTNYKNEIVENDLITLSLSKDKFGAREKVSLNISSTNQNIAEGNYSISVQKIDAIPLTPKATSTTYQSLFDGNNSKKRDLTSLVIPEFRGELISGIVIDKVSNLPASNVPISLSIPEKNYTLKNSKTDNSGNFYFNVNKEYNSSNALIQIINENGENLKIVMNEDIPVDYKNLEFKKFELSEKVKDLIIERSINNQVENAYNLLKQDSLVSSNNTDRFYTSNNYEYILDNYKRFSTLRETITEIVEHVFYNKKGDQYSINIIGFDFMSKENKPLILVDGILILDHNEIIDLNTEKVKKITVLKENYIYGTKSFNGVIAIETFEGDYQSLKSADYIKNITLFKPLTTKKYFNVMYDKKLDRIPDVRRQLFWKPDFVLNNNGTPIVFYTSDNKGVYEVNLEGFTNDGRPVSIKKFLSIR